MLKIDYKIAVLSLIAIAGCESIGQTPTGPPPAEIKSNIAALPLETRVKIEMGSPAPMDQKRKMIEDMYTQAGQKLPDDVAKQIGASAH